MNPSEIAFLALGLVLGGALGAAFLAAVRSGPAPGARSAITIAPNAIAAPAGPPRSPTRRRSATAVRPRARPTTPPGRTAPRRCRRRPPCRAARPPSRSIQCEHAFQSPPSRVPATAVAVAIAGGRAGPPGGAGLADRPVPRARARRGNGRRWPGLPWRSPTRPARRPWPGLPSTSAASPERLVRPRLPPSPSGRPSPRPPWAIAVAGAGEPEGSIPDPSPAAATTGDPLAAAARRRRRTPCADPAPSWRSAAPWPTSAREQARGGGGRRCATRSGRSTCCASGSSGRGSCPIRGAIAAAKAALHAAVPGRGQAAASPDEAEAAARRWLHGINQANNDVRDGSPRRGGGHGGAARAPAPTSNASPWRPTRRGSPPRAPTRRAGTRATSWRGARSTSPRPRPPRSAGGAAPVRRDLAAQQDLTSADRRGRARGRARRAVRDRARAARRSGGARPRGGRARGLGPGGASRLADADRRRSWTRSSRGRSRPAT